MSRTSLVAGNWKMNKTVAEARDLVSTMSPKLREIANVEKVVVPSLHCDPCSGWDAGRFRNWSRRAEHALGGEGRVHRRGFAGHGEGILQVRHHRSFGAPRLFRRNG